MMSVLSTFVYPIPPLENGEGLEFDRKDSINDAIKDDKKY